MFTDIVEFRQHLNLNSSVSRTYVPLYIYVKSDRRLSDGTDTNISSQYIRLCYRISHSLIHESLNNYNDP